jgi:hypothetical protein
MVEIVRGNTMKEKGGWFEKQREKPLSQRFTTPTLSQQCLVLKAKKWA